MNYFYATPLVLRVDVDPGTYYIIINIITEFLTNTVIVVFCNIKYKLSKDKNTRATPA